MENQKYISVFCLISTKICANFLTQHNVETTIEQSAKQIQDISLWPVSDRTLKHIYKKLVSHFNSKITTYQLHKLVSELAFSVKYLLYDVHLASTRLEPHLPSEMPVQDSMCKL